MKIKSEKYFLNYILTGLSIFVFSLFFPLLIRGIKFPLLPLDIAIRVFSWSAIIGFLLSLINTVIWGYRYHSKHKENEISPLKYFPLKTWAIFWVSFCCVFFLGAIMESSSRIAIKNFLDHHIDAYEVKVNGKEISDHQNIITELRKLKPYQEHHSHAINFINIELAYKNEYLVLQVGQDSQNPKEYWVFYPRYHYTKTNEIGRITTNIF